MPPNGGENQDAEEEEKYNLPPMLKEYINWLVHNFPTVGTSGALKIHPGGENWRDKFPHGPVHVMIEAATWIEQQYPTKNWDAAEGEGRRAMIRDLHALVCDVIVCDPLVFCYDILICHPDWQVKEKPKRASKGHSAAEDDCPVVGISPLCFGCGKNDCTDATYKGWSFAAGLCIGTPVHNVCARACV